MSDLARALEKQLTPDELQHAFAVMDANGWSRGDMPPAWCWIDVFSRILARREEEGRT